jgi:hypothetical protein
LRIARVPPKVLVHQGVFPTELPQTAPNNHFATPNSPKSTASLKRDAHREAEREEEGEKGVRLENVREQHVI